MSLAHPFIGLHKKPGKAGFAIKYDSTIYGQQTVDCIYRGRWTVD